MKEKRKKIEAAGYEVTDSADWLGLDTAERTIVAMRISLAEELDRLRKEKKLSQSDLAKILGTRQPGVSRLISDPSATTLDALVRALLTLGATSRHIAAFL
ncbi:MAG TPA: helix-turn-helix transcriptional regulator [Kiritimatiellia bacterium]|nr:helix-turn-helix transcriptional regulator [Kiritimatiellia bacterium]